MFNELSNCGLDLSGNRLTTLDARVFEGVGFISLNLSDNYISDIDFLSGLSWALSINLSGNGIVDVSPLSGVGSISTLDLSRNRIVDVSPLASLPNHLDSLDLSYNEIDDISPLLVRVRGGSIGEESSLFLHGNRVRGEAFAEHVATLRSRGVGVFLVSILPMDSSALEGEELEFAVRLSSEVAYSVTVDWQIFFAFFGQRGVLADALITSNAYDLGFGGLFERASCPGLLCYAQGVGGEVTIGVDGIGKVTVSTDRDEHVEEHETFGFLLSRGASVFPEAVSLDTSIGRQSVAVGLIVDPAGPSHHIPLFLARGDAWERENILRLVHPMNGSPAHVEVFDSLGRRHGATTLSTRHDPSARRFDPSRRAVAQFDSEDLEDGDHDTGLSRGVGPGGSDWRLKVWTNDAVVLSYVRHADGFLTSVHDVARQEADGTYAVPFFNPASNTQQRSILRLVNSGTQASEVRIVGTDDAGATSDEAVSLSIDPGAVRELSAADLEAGAADLRGALGNGRGKWRLALASDEPLLVASLLESPTGHLSNLSTLPDNKEQGAEGTTTHHVPLFLSAADEWGRRSFLRVVNKDEEAATVHIRPFDDTVRDYGTVILTVAPGEAAHFNSHHLEVGGQGLSDGVGAGEGDWRLELESMADIDVLAYVRHGDGFLTSMHDVVRTSAEGHVVPIFNPADDDQKSVLRLVNPRGDDAEVSIRGIDDRGVTRGSVSLVVPAGRSRTLSARMLEAGHDTLAGALGNGEGKWRLVVRSDVQIQVMSLLEGVAGHLTNLSTAPLVPETSTITSPD